MSKIIHLEDIASGKERLAILQWARTQLAPMKRDRRADQPEKVEKSNRQPTEPPKKAA